jgi:broad specificity phosphatase PhoE
MREDAGDVSFMRSPGLDAASVALPGGIDLEDCAARMNEFWKALVEFQHRNVLVVAVCAGEEL